MVVLEESIKKEVVMIDPDTWYTQNSYTLPVDNSKLLSEIVDTNTKETGSKWNWSEFIGSLVQAAPSTISAIKGTTSPATPTAPKGKISGNVTVDSILSSLGVKPTITGVSMDIPKWVYLVMIAAAIMLFFPFLKSIKSMIRRR